MNQPTKKIVIIGPESTGKSTVAEDLAQYFSTSFVPEYAREYIDALVRPYGYDDLWKIAEGQIALEDAGMKAAKKDYLFFDTNLYVLKVWSEHKYGTCDERILREISRRNYDFYFLTNIDLPWEEDPQREHPEPEMRQHFFQIYRDIVINSGKPWVCLSGDRRQRLDAAVAAILNGF